MPRATIVETLPVRLTRPCQNGTLYCRSEGNIWACRFATDGASRGDNYHAAATVAPTTSPMIVVA